MFEKVITKKTKQNLAKLSKVSFMKDFYLAGDTALALQFGHRTSLDLDFFSPKEFRPELLAARLEKIGGFSLKSKAWGTLHGVFAGTRITFLYYPYPLLSPKKKFLKINLANWTDIACMKLDAISTRGSKKDFIDIYFIRQKIAFKKLFRLFAKKYKSVDFNMIHLFKSLCYFKEAEKQPMPKMFKIVSWQEVKEFFIEQVKKLKKEEF